jgi:endo-1,4-beta-xylanase
VAEPQNEKEVFPPLEQSTLREYASKRGLWIGTTIQDAYWDEDVRYKATLAREFNLGVTFVFMRLTQPERGRFNFRVMDKVMKFAKENKMKLAGHALLYRDSTEPTWLHFDRSDCGGWSKKELNQIMKNHIQTVVSHGGEDFYVWDVVNEPLAKNGDMLPKCWYKILGEDYIANAFRYAREVNPKTLLRLNETFGQRGVDGEKAKSFFALVERLKERQVPIDAIGIQMHLEAPELRSSYLKEWRDFLQKAAALSLQVHVTEMDVYQGSVEVFHQPFEKQKEIFKAIVKTCLEFSHCTAFTTWGLTDKHNWPKQRATDQHPDAEPLLFSAEYQKKPAYFGVMEAIRESKLAREL